MDHVISRQLIPALDSGWDNQRAALLDYAHSVFDEQFSFLLRN